MQARVCTCTIIIVFQQRNIYCNIIIATAKINETSRDFMLHTNYGLYKMLTLCMCVYVWDERIIYIKIYTFTWVCTIVYILFTWSEMIRPRVLLAQLPHLLIYILKCQWTRSWFNMRECFAIYGFNNIKCFPNGNFSFLWMYKTDNQFAKYVVKFIVIVSMIWPRSHGSQSIKRCA